jgi:hypothetical protein
MYSFSFFYPRFKSIFVTKEERKQCKEVIEVTVGNNKVLTEICSLKFVLECCSNRISTSFVLTIYSPNNIELSDLSKGRYQISRYMIDIQKNYIIFQNFMTKRVSCKNFENKNKLSKPYKHLFYGV